MIIIAKLHSNRGYDMKNFNKGRVWNGSFIERAVVIIAICFALFALSVSGSILQAISALFSASRNGTELIPWQAVINAFLKDITGSPGLFISAIKTVFAIAVAFAAVSFIKNLRGEMSRREVLNVKLNGTQSGVLVWCAVFALVKLL